MHTVVIGESCFTLACVAEALDRSKQVTLVTDPKTAHQAANYVGNNTQGILTVFSTDMQDERYLNRILRVISPKKPWSLLLHHTQQVHDKEGVEAVRMMIRRNTRMTDAIVTRARFYQPENILILGATQIESPPQRDVQLQNYYDTMIWLRDYAQEAGIMLGILGNTLCPNEMRDTLTGAVIELSLFISIHTEERQKWAQDFLNLEGDLYLKTMKIVADYFDGSQTKPLSPAHLYGCVFRDVIESIHPHWDSLRTYFEDSGLIPSVQKTAKRTVDTLFEPENSSRHLVRLYGNDVLATHALTNRVFYGERH